MNNPLISVIIPIYNVDNYLKKCIDSVINQTYNNLEIILINDGSTDKSYDIILSYEKYKNVIIINKANSGQSDCRNIGYKTSNGEYVYFMDSDDILEPKAIEVLYNTIIKHDADICCCRFRLINEQNKALKESALYKQELIEDNTIILREALLTSEIKSTLWTKLLRKKFLEIYSIEPIKEIILHDDCMFTFLCAIYASRVCFTNEILYNALQRNNSISRTCKPIMVTIYDDIYKILKKELDNTGKFETVQIDYYLGYGKSIIYVLLLAAIRSKNYKNYLYIYNSINKNSLYYSDQLLKTLKKYSKNKYLLLLLSKKPLIYYHLSKLTKYILHH